MRIQAALGGDLQKHMADELEYATRGVRRGVERVQGVLKQRLRNQVRPVLGEKVANTWTDKGRRGKLFYPNNGLDAAAIVMSKAPDIIAGFTDGSVIRSRKGKMLAIPTDAAKRKGRGRRRVKPSDFRLGNRLEYIARKDGYDLLALKGKRKKNGGLRKGSVMFVLVPVVRLPRKLPNWEAEATRIEALMPAAIIDAINKEAGGA